MAKLARFLWPTHIPIIVRLLFWAGILLAAGAWLSRHWYEWGQSAYHATISIAAALFALSAIINGQTARFEAIRAQGRRPFHPLVRFLLWSGALVWLVGFIWSEIDSASPPPKGIDGVAISVFLLGLQVHGFILHALTPAPEDTGRARTPTRIKRINYLRLLPWIGWYLMHFQYRALAGGWWPEGAAQTPFKLGTGLIILCYAWDWFRTGRRRARLARGTSRGSRARRRSS